MDDAGTLRERVAAAAGRLSPKERRVAQYLQANPGRVAASSAATLAALIGTSDATVVRTARSLGYAGFTELRRSMAAEGPFRTAASVLAERMDHVDGVDDVLASTVEDTLGLVARLSEQRTAAAWAAAARLLEGASRVWTIGFGPAATPAEFLALSLSRIGVESTAITTTGFRMADDLLRIRAAEVVVVFAPGRLFQEIDAALERVREVGASSVVVSEALGLALRDRADVVISTPGTTDSSASELTAALLLSHSWTLRLARRDRERTLGRLAELNRVRTRIVGGPLDAV
ncbi:MurR/RpiR family transcriptional regulator [Pseudonocardia lacus]|uniref:MurR/RpiR family transcriptional regulator n=1 Tax=Pseudonocardia lacus TaxID=2835865 RepID=UPI001BDC6D8A|nr:MurR/RpiR family transcriptional regulator [Pseudonocardia lacus]